MTTVYQIITEGTHDAVVATFDMALKRIELMLNPQGEHLKLYRLPHAIPALGEHNLSGSRGHKLRWIANQKNQRIEIVEHHADMQFAHLPTSRSKIDLLDDFDPGYEVQAHLYVLSMTDETIDDLKTRLFDAAQSKLAMMRREFKDDYEVLRRLKHMHDLFGGEDCVSAVRESGFRYVNATLDQLPHVMVDRFEDQARLAYPTPALTA